MNIFGIGIGEALLVLIIGLIILGPGKLVELAQSLGRLSRNLKKMSSEFTNIVNKEIEIQGKELGNSHHDKNNTNSKAFSATNMPEDTENTDTEGKK